MLSEIGLPRFTQLLIALALLSVATDAMAQDGCRLRSFSVVACTAPSAVGEAVTATNERQLRSIGCTKLDGKPRIHVVDQYSDVTKITITTANSIVPLWISTWSLDCSPGGSSTGAPHFPSAHQKTGDGFVWKEGKRIGWVDDASSTYYRLDEIVIEGQAQPRLKPGVSGTKIVSTLDAAIMGLDRPPSEPAGSPLEQTADGFVWRSGKRIGWLDTSTGAYYRLDQIEIRPDYTARPKSGEVGVHLRSGDLREAVARAEKKS